MRRETVALGIFAAGQVLSGVFSLTGMTLVVAEIALAGPLVATLDTRSLPPFAVASGVLLMVFGIGRSYSTVVAAAATVVAGVVLLYGLHRYELVALGLVEG